MVYGEPDRRPTLTRTLQTATRADHREWLAADLAARVPSPASQNKLSFSQVKAMLRERLSSLLLQDRKQLRTLFSKHDPSNHGVLTTEGLHKLCRDIGCDLTESDVDHMIRRHSPQKGVILFVDFCSELLGLPDGFFSKDLIKTDPFGKPEASSGPGAQEKCEKLPLPRGTSMDQVQRTFVNKMRAEMFDVGAVINRVLFRPNSCTSTFTQDQFFNILRSHEMLVSRAQLEELFTYLDHNCDGLLHYEELSCELLGLKRPKQVRHQTRHFERKPLHPSTERVLNRLRVIAEREAASPQKLSTMFQTYDQDGSGEIAYDEFDIMIKQMGCRVKGANSAEQLLGRFDHKGTGSLSYTDFITNVMRLQPDALRMPGDDLNRPSSPEMLQSVANGVKRHLIGKKSVVERALRFFDANGGGDISIREFHDGIEALGLPMSKGQVKKLFKEIDVSGDGSVDASEIASNILGFDDGQAVSTQVRRDTPDRPNHYKTASKLSASARSGRKSTAGSRTIQTPLLPRTPGQAPLLKNNAPPRTPGQAPPRTPGQAPRTAAPRTPGTSHSLMSAAARSASTPPMRFPNHGPVGTPGPGPRGGGWPGSNMARVAQCKTPSRLIVRDMRHTKGAQQPPTTRMNLDNLNQAKIQSLLEQTHKMRQQIERAGPQSPPRTGSSKLQPLQLDKLALQGGDGDADQLLDLSTKLNSFASELNHLSMPSTRSRPPTIHEH